MSVFNCKMCGKCCKNIRGRTYDNNPLDLPSFMYLLTPPTTATISIFDWQRNNLEKKAKELSLKIKIKPVALFWDTKSKQAIAWLWNLDNDSCPFLSSKNKCMIHNENPLVCQAYPLVFFLAVFSSHILPLRIVPNMSNTLFLDF